MFCPTDRLRMNFGFWNSLSQTMHDGSCLRRREGCRGWAAFVPPWGRGKLPRAQASPKEGSGEGWTLPSNAPSGKIFISDQPETPFSVHFLPTFLPSMTILERTFLWRKSEKKLYFGNKNLKLSQLFVSRVMCKKDYFRVFRDGWSSKKVSHFPKKKNIRENATTIYMAKKFVYRILKAGKKQYWRRQ